MSADGNQDFLNEGAGRSGDMQQVDSLWYSQWNGMCRTAK